MEKEEKSFRVSSSTDSNKLAGSICAVYDKENHFNIKLRFIGAGAMNQATKAVIVSNRHFIKKGKIACMIPYFFDFDNNMTGVEFRLELKDA